MKKLTSAIALLALMILSSSFTPPVQLQQQYAIIHNGKNVGYLRLLSQEKDALQFVSMHGQVLIKSLIAINVHSKEEALFEHGILQWSTTEREVNGKNKTAKSTRLAAPGYELQDGSTKKKLDSTHITSTIMGLYVNEPIDGAFVYSDNHQCFLKVKLTAPHQYRINMPEGGYNEYQYKNGVCTQVEVHHTLYRLTFSLL